MRLVYTIGIALTKTPGVILQAMKQKWSHLFRFHVGFWPRGERCNFTGNETEVVTSLQISCGLLAKRRDKTEENGREYYVIECV